MKTLLHIWMISLGLVAAASCTLQSMGLGPVDSDADADADADVDVDVDADSDVDLDTEADGDADSDVDTDVDGDIDGDVDGDPDIDPDIDEDGDECDPVAEECNGLDDDCDGEVDEDFDLASSLDHCGACEHACPVDPPNATPVCVRGLCDLQCHDGFADCAPDVEGCESQLSAPTTCGACTVSCADPTPLCSEQADGSYRCAGTCPRETTPCGESCVDTDTSLLHCGACDNACPSPASATPVCRRGVCGFECNEGFDNCDHIADTGCETALGTNDDCAACDDACGAGAACVEGACVGECADGCDCTATCTLETPCVCDGGCHCFGLECAGDCEMTCDQADTECVLDAAGDGDIGFRCDHTATCDVDCSISATCDANCDHGARCDLDCYGAESCVVDCHHTSECEVDCTSASDCNVRCRDGSRCLIDCADTADDSCVIDDCGAADLHDCGGGLFACRRDCPVP